MVLKIEPVRETERESEQLLSPVDQAHAEILGPKAEQQAKVAAACVPTAPACAGHRWQLHVTRRLRSTCF